MLVLTRKPGESVFIDDDIKIYVVGIKGYSVKMAFDAPPNVRIYRNEIYDKYYNMEDCERLKKKFDEYNHIRQKDEY